MSEREFGRRRGGDDEAGESYFVSMSDLMAGVLFLFIIMLTNFALLLRTAPPRPMKSPVKTVAPAAVEKLNLTEVKPANGPAPIGPPPLPDARTAALYAIADQLKARGVTVTVDIPAGALRFANDAVFAASGSSLSNEGRTAVNALAQALASVLPCFTTGGVHGAACPNATGHIGAAVIEAHADTGSATDWSASVGQGSAAFQGLLQADPSLQNLLSPGGQPLLSVAGYGPSRPVQPGTDPARRRLNSRLDLHLVLTS